MNPTRWQLMQQLVESAVELGPEDRACFLDQSCAGSPTLRTAVDGMLSAYGLTDNFFEGAIGIAAARIGIGHELTAADSIGPYRIAGLLGHGGMGSVYRAQRADDQFRQAVAVKVVRTSPGTNQELFARFRAERQILANINHPNIARLLDGGVTEDGRPYLVMEYVEGTTLDRYVKEAAPSLPDRLALFQALCAAIQYAHQNLIVHRDLKPANILITAEGTPKLLDFGIAKLLAPDTSPNARHDAHPDTIIYTRPAERLMTPEYASPEQITGQTITTATDIYSLGVLLYELLANRRAFQLSGLSSAEIEKLICETQPQPPSTLSAEAPTPASRIAHRKQSDLDRITLKAMHKLPERRYASAADLSLDVQRYLDGFPVAARPDTVGYRTRRFIQRHKLAFATAVLFLLTIVGLSVNLAVQARRARREAASADAVSNYLVGLFNLTQPDSTQGRSVSARELLDQGTQTLDRQWTGEPTVKAHLLSTLGSVYYQLGALDQAANLFNHSIEIYTHETGADSPVVADLSNSLGEVELDKGDYVHSLQHYRAAVRIFEETRPESAELADAMDGVSGVLWELGSFKESEQYHIKCIAMASRILGPDAPQTLVDKNNYQVLLVDMGRYTQAESLAREVLAARLKLFGPTNAHTASSVFNLAVVLFKEGRLAQAKPLFDQSLATRRILYGNEHHNIAKTLMYLGLYFRQLGDYASARESAEQAVRMTAKLQSEQSLDTAAAEDSLALILLDQHDPTAARLWANKALRTRTAQPTPSPALISLSYDHLGLIDLAEGQLTPALTNIQSALRMRQAFYTPDSDLIATSYISLGRVQSARRELKPALTAFQAALRIAKQDFGSAPHPLTIEALNGIGTASLATGDTPTASAALTESMQMQQQLYPPTNPTRIATAQTLQALSSRPHPRTPR